MQKTRSWTQQETQVLRREGKRKFPHELAVLLPGRTEIAIASKRRKLGIKLPASYFSRIGLGTVDAKLGRICPILEQNLANFMILPPKNRTNPTI